MSNCPKCKEAQAEIAGLRIDLESETKWAEHYFKDWQKSDEALEKANKRIALLEAALKKIELSTTCQTTRLFAQTIRQS